MFFNISNFKPKSSGRKKKHFCTKCSASFRATHELSDHMKSIHKGLKPYNCSICDSKFSYQRNLRYHEKTAHEIEKSSLNGNGFHCPKCSDCFFQKSSLIQHMNDFHSISSDKKKLRCELCGFGVTNAGKLKMHMRAKHLKENDEKTVYIKEENDEKTIYIKEESSLSESNEFHSDCFGKVHTF